MRTRIEIPPTPQQIYVARDAVGIDTYRVFNSDGMATAKSPISIALPKRKRDIDPVATTTQHMDLCSDQAYGQLFCY